MLLTLIVALATSQVTSVKIVNPENQSQGLGNANPIKVNCVSGCSGSSGGGGGGTLDGGFVGVSSLPLVFIADAGVLNVNFPTSQTVNGTVTANQGSPPWTVANSVVTSANSDGASVTVGAASGTCLVSNSSRQGCSICLDPSATQNIHVRFSASAATTSFQPLVPGQCAYCGTGNRVYTGAVTCISDSGNQTAYALELN